MKFWNARQPIFDIFCLFASWITVSNIKKTLKNSWAQLIFSYYYNNFWRGGHFWEKTASSRVKYLEILCLIDDLILWLRFWKLNKKDDKYLYFGKTSDFLTDSLSSSARSSMSFALVSGCSKIYCASSPFASVGDTVTKFSSSSSRDIP